MKILKYYDTIFSAEVARGRLESEGITAIVQNESLGNILPLGDVIQSFKPYLVVNDEDLAQAAEILGITLDEAQADKVCPQCGSCDVVAKTFYEDGDFNLNKVRKIFPLLSLFGIVQTESVRRKYHCRRCNRWF